MARGDPPRGGGARGRSGGSATRQAAAEGRARQAATRPWREVVVPHPEVRGGRYRQAEFAADLAQVVAGKAPVEYGDPTEFFARTHLTDGLRRLLVAALRRLGGHGGDSVVLLRTGFGGGKTHALLALYHLLGGRAGAGSAAPAAGAVLLQQARLHRLPPARTAVLVGTDVSPARPWACHSLGGRPVRTLWGELAAQLGGAAAYADVQRADEAGVPPGTAELVRLLDAHGPALLLVDELVAFARTLHGRRGLPAGSFDANLTFLHALGEAVRRSAASLLVLTLPASDVELGGDAGRAAMERIDGAMGRVESGWRPVATSERLQVVRRRLFAPVADDAAREAACLAFGRMYAERPADFPPEAREGLYLERLRAGYPVHPELLDRLEEGWATLERFQGTRGVLRLMAAAIHELWRRGDDAPLILPGSLPLDAPRVRDELTRCLDEEWQAVLEADVDGASAAATLVDRERPRWQQARAARRVARAILLGSAPSFRGRAARGIEEIRIQLGVVQPGEPVALFRDALARLTERLTHLHGDGRRLWLDTRPNLLHTVGERAVRVEGWRVRQELWRRLRVRDRGDFAAVHLHQPGAEVADEPAARLVVLPPDHPHRPVGTGEPAPHTPALALAGEILERRGPAGRRYRNMLVFLAADRGATDALEQAARQCLAWRSVLEDADQGLLELDRFQRGQARDSLRAAEVTLRHRLQEAYRWLLVPTQAGTDAVRWEELDVPGGEPYAVRASRGLRSRELLVTRWSPALLRRELDRWLWTDAPHVALGRVWEALASYLYLPRLRSADVLLATVAEGVRAGDHFAYAAGVAEDGRYTGLRLGEAVAEVRLDGAAVLVRPEAAVRQLAGRSAASAAVPASPAPSALPNRFRTDGGGRRRPAQPDGAAPCPDRAAPCPDRAAAPPAPAVVRRFRGSVALDPLHTERDLAPVVSEILRHLTDAGTAVEVQVHLDIMAESPAGFPPEIVRVLKENSRALKFRVADLEP